MANERSTLSDRRRSGLDSGLDVIELLGCSQQQMTLTDIARSLRMSKSGVHSVLATLLRRDFVARSVDGTYRLGVKAWEIGCAAPDAELAHGAAPHMARLAEDVSEGVILGRLDGADVVYLQLVDGPQAVRVHASVGDRIPAYCTSTGLALLAALPLEEVNAKLPGKLRAVSPETITSREELVRELERTRTRGYSVNRGGWRADVAGIAVCVRDPNGSTIAGLCVAVPRYRMTKAWLTRVRPHLAAAADRIGSTARPHPGVRGAASQNRQLA